MSIGQPPPDTPEPLRRYLTEIAVAINRIEAQRPARDPWDVSNITELRVLDGGTASTGDVRNGFATLVRDLINRGILTGNRV